MCQYDCDISLAEAEENEEQEQGDTCDHIRIEHRDVVEKLHRLFPASAQVEYADGGNCSQYRGQACRDDSNNKGVLDGRHQ